jgi:hypothetical protein
MTPFWFLVVQALASGAQVISIIFLIGQLLLMRGQLLASQQNIISQQKELAKQTNASVQASQAANLFEVFKYLEEPRHLVARKIVDTLIDKDFDQWTQEERDAADLVRRLWTIAPTLQRMSLLPPNYLQYYYGNTIMRHWQAVKPLVDELRRKTTSGICVEFEEMAKRSRRVGWFAEGGDYRPRDRYNLFAQFVNEPGGPTFKS